MRAAERRVFITTKVWISNAGYEKAKASIEESLKKLQVSYIDLLLIHQLYPDRFIDLHHFAEGKNDYFNNPVLKEIGASHSKSAAQVVLRFLIQSDVVVIPKSTHKERMEENFNVFDFELPADEMVKVETVYICSLKSRGFRLGGVHRDDW